MLNSRFTSATASSIEGHVPAMEMEYEPLLLTFKSPMRRPLSSRISYTALLTVSFGSPFV